MDYTLPEVKIINRHLDNAECRKSGEILFKSWEDVMLKGNFPLNWTPEQVNQLVVLHYTVCRSVNSTYQTYGDSGVSAHFTLGNDGDIFCSVNPDRNIAFHAGISHFATFERLNFYSIGIEHVNPGGGPTYIEYDGFAPPIQFEGDSGFWYPFSEVQFKASMSLVQRLQKRYKIPGWYVVTHGDVAIGRKSDTGPAWPYKTAFDEYGVGYWPSETHAISPGDVKLEDEDYISLIRAFGYSSNDTKSLVRAYQLHYSVGNISGTLTDVTKKSILEQTVGLHGYVDPTTGGRYDFFAERFSEWVSANPKAAGGFKEYFPVDK